MWLLAVILIVALMIPVAAILVDSPLGKSVARRMDKSPNGGPELHDMQRKVELLESEIEELNRSVSEMRDELQFVQRLLEDPKRKHPTS